MQNPRLRPRSPLKRACYPILTVAISLALGACGSDSGSCVATGGVLSSPACYENYTKSECSEQNDIGVNGATWTFNSSNSCVELGYTEQCSSNVFREAGAC